MAEDVARRKRRLDAMNTRIVNLLQRDAKMTTAEVARRIKRSESTVRERIYAMERERIIQGYCAVVDKAALGYHSEALVFCNIPADGMEPTLAKLESLKNVLGIYLISGDRRVVLRVAAGDNQELRHIVHRKIIPMGVTDVDSRIIMDYREKLPPGGIIDEDIDRT